MSSRSLATQPTFAICSALAVAIVAGCTGGKVASRDASARLLVSTAALGAQVAKVEVTVAKGTGTPDFTPIVATLSPVGTGWSGFITGIPAGAGRQFDVVAYDSSGGTVATGGGRADVVAAGTATVTITLSMSSPGSSFQNSAPVIDYLSASETLVQTGGQVRLWSSAHDPDPGDTIYYSWVASCGTMANPAAPVVDWVAPATQGSCLVSVAVTDSRGASVAAYLLIQVGVATVGDVLVTATGGTTGGPSITGMAAQVTQGDPITGALMVIAVDPAGGTLSYTWTSDCAGVTFDTVPPHAPTAPMFTSTDTAKSCNLTVTVTDAAGAKTMGTIRIGPKPSLNLAPVITAAVQPTVDVNDPLKAEPVKPGDAVSLQLLATDPEGGTLTFQWTASAGTLDGQVDQTTSPGKSVVTFHVPATIPAGLKVTVMVSDPLGASNEHVFWFKAG